MSDLQQEPSKYKKLSWKTWEWIHNCDIDCYDHEDDDVADGGSDDDDDDIFYKSKMTRLRAVYWNANLMMGEGIGGEMITSLCKK